MRAPHLNRVLTLRQMSAAASRRVAAATSPVDSPDDSTLDTSHTLGASSPLPCLPRVVNAGKQQAIPPLPEPILYHGPSRGSTSRSIRTNSDILPTSLPPPKVFDGPASPGLPKQPVRACAPASRHVSSSQSIVFPFIDFFFKGTPTAVMIPLLVYRTVDGVSYCMILVDTRST
jgi:hypothetical protein